MSPSRELPGELLGDRVSLAQARQKALRKSFVTVSPSQVAASYSTDRNCSSTGTRPWTNSMY